MRITAITKTGAKERQEEEGLSSEDITSRTHDHETLWLHNANGYTNELENGVGTEQNTFFHGSGVEFLDQVREDGNDERVIQ